MLTPVNIAKSTSDTMVNGYTAISNFVAIIYIEVEPHCVGSYWCSG